MNRQKLSLGRVEHDFFLYDVMSSVNKASSLEELKTRRIFLIMYALKNDRLNTN